MYLMMEKIPSSLGITLFKVTPIMSIPLENYPINCYFIISEKWNQKKEEQDKIEKLYIVYKYF